jgi:hypothetical protein
VARALLHLRVKRQLGRLGLQLSRIEGNQEEMNMFKRTILALTVAALAITGVAQAQENATLTMRSGERVSGQLVDMGGSGFAVRVNGQDRQIPTGDVAVIDFSGGSPSDADWANVTNGQQLLSMRDGSTLTGQLYDIGGTTPLKITFKTSSGDREISSSQIARILLAKPSGAAATGTNASLAAATGSGISVSPRQAWTSTGLTVRKGEVLSFNTSGEVQLSGDANDVAAPAGSKTGRRATGAPLPTALAGALIARIGNGQAFAIGNQTTVTMPAAGQLFLGVNDDGFDDNQGEFRVDIQRSASRR